LVSIWLAFNAITDVINPPGPFAVLAIVSTGLCFTVFVFEALRIGPACRMAKTPVPDQIIEQHLSSDMAVSLCP